MIKKNKKSNEIKNDKSINSVRHKEIDKNLFASNEEMEKGINGIMGLHEKH